MKVTYIELLGKKHPLCFSLGAAEALVGEFGSMENLDKEIGSKDVGRIAKATNTLLEILLKAGRIYAGAMGDELPDELPCRPADVIDVRDKNVLADAMAAIRGDTAREVETDSKNMEATQGL